MKLLHDVEQYMRKAHGAQGFKIGNLRIKASRWPWQGYGWFPHKNGKSPLRAPLNPDGARFGGGWRYKLGISFGGSTVMIDLLFGTVSIYKDWKAANAA